MTYKFDPSTVLYFSLASDEDGDGVYMQNYIDGDYVTREAWEQLLELYNKLKEAKKMNFEPEKVQRFSVHDSEIIMRDDTFSEDYSLMVMSQDYDDLLKLYRETEFAAAHWKAMMEEWREAARKREVGEIPADEIPF